MISLARQATAGAQRSFPFRVVIKFLQDGGTNHAVLIAWNALTSLFPIVLAVLAIAGGLLSAFGVARQKIVQLVFNLFPVGGSEWSATIDALQSIQQRPGLFGVLAVVSFLWSASGLFGTLEWSLGVILHAPARPFARQKLMALGMMLLFCLLTVAAVGSATVLAVLRTVQIPLGPPQLTAGITGPVIQFLVGVMAGFLLFYSIYAVVPNRPHRALHVLPGALVGGIGFELLTLLFPLYVSLNSGINQYGRQFAFLLVLLFFFYFLGLITVLGAEVNSVLFPASEAEPQPEGQVKKPLRERVPAPVMSLLGIVLGLGLALRQRRRSGAG